ncbi:MAG: hypothetical protein ACFE75_11705 [Candidatus Hodarchaeota archaeon]
MEEDSKLFSWTAKLDWLNILSMLNLDSISEIPIDKKEKAIKRISRFYSLEALMDFEPSYLDKLVVNELKELMRKELRTKAEEERKAEQRIRDTITPFKRGGIIKIDPRDLPKDFNGDPEEMLKYFYKKFLGKDDDENDDENDKYKEDNTGYYI